MIPCYFKINWIQLLQVYKTHTKYFVIGSNNEETRFRILKIDRTEPKELVITEDKVEYNLTEIKEIIERLHAGNFGKKKSSWRNRGLVQTLTAFGIIGFVRFLEGYYMILVTKRAIEAELGGHRVYKIEDTSMIYIPNSNSRNGHPDESKYLKSFQTVDLSSNFYYSHGYDLTNSLQHNITLQYSCTHVLGEKLEDGTEGESNSSTPESWENASFGSEEPSANVLHEKKKALCLEPTCCERYIWNQFLKDPLSKLDGNIASDWTVDIIHGFLGQIKINVYGKPVYVTLIARRSSLFAGTRFLKRGCNVKGDVANEVETEQIVHSATSTLFLKGQYTSYIQHRGSVPVHWFQDITSSVVPAKPPIIIAISNPYAQATGLHFSQLYERYGSPIIALNLVRKHERRSRESQLGEAFKSSIDYLNLFLSVQDRIIYQHIDMAHLSHSTKSDVLVKLAAVAESNLHKTGFFQSNVKLFEHNLRENEKWKLLKGETVGPFRIQTGVVRSNCVDCLDRTNSAQFVASKCALAYQLFSLGVLPSPEIEFDTDAIRLFEELFEEHGDIVALQYGGSQLVHTIQSYRQTAVLASHSRDIVTTLSRYYSNTFSDAYKQSAINLFLGVFKPEDHDCPQWDLVTDNYLHNPSEIVLSSFSNYGSYTMWLVHNLRSMLPLPADVAVFLQTTSTLKKYLLEVKLLPVSDQSNDWFDEFYRTGELTSFEDVYGLSMIDSMSACLASGYTNISPFALRADKWQELKNQNKVSDSMSSQSSIDQSSSSDEESVLGVRYTADEGIDVLQSSTADRSGSSIPDPRRDFSPIAMYGSKIAWQPSRQDMNIYRRYIAVEDILNKFIPMSVFSQDSSYYVEPPTVDRQSRQIYEKSVACSTHYPTTLLTSHKVYQEYANSVAE